MKSQITKILINLIKYQQINGGQFQSKINEPIKKGLLIDGQKKINQIMNFNQQQTVQHNSPTSDLFENPNQEGSITPHFQNGVHVPFFQQTQLSQLQSNQMISQQQQYLHNQQQNTHPDIQGNYNQQFQFPNNNIFLNDNFLNNQMMYTTSYQNQYNNNQQQNPRLSYQKNQQYDQLFLNNKGFNFDQQQNTNHSRHKKSKTSNEIVLQKKLWLSVTIEICSLNRELDGKLNSYLSQHSIVNDIKVDLLQQLHNMSKLPAHQFEEYNFNSRIVYHGNLINDTLSLMQMLGTVEPQILIECKLQLAHCKIKLTKRGYYTFPKISDLLAADEQQLSQVEDFQISNELGTIIWPGKTDLRFVDLDEINITQFDIEVYNNLPTLMKPKVGDKLNKSCFSEFKISYDVLLRDWGCKNDNDIACFLSRKFEEKQMMFINDDSSNKIVIFGKEIPHFSLNDFYHKSV